MILVSVNLLNPIRCAPAKRISVTPDVEQACDLAPTQNGMLGPSRFWRRTDKSSQRVGRMLVEVMSRPVVAPGGPWVGTTLSVLDVAGAVAGVQAQGHERVPEVVRMEGVGLGGNGGPSQPTECPPRFRAIPAASCGRAEERTGLSTIEVGINSLGRPGGQWHIGLGSALARVIVRTR